MAPITHIVAFKWKTSLSPAETKEASDKMLGLGQTCQKDGKPYILSSKGGLQNSPEGRHHDMSAVFIHEFANEADRDYYLDHDPAHVAFKEYIGKLVDGAIVLDFSPF